MTLARRTVVVLVAVVVVLVALRAALPVALTRYVDRVLDRSEDFDGSIEDVDLALWRGAYVIEGLRLDHEEKEELRPLLDADRIDLALQWSALLHGSLVAEVRIDGLVYNVVAAPPSADEALAQTGEKPDLAERLSELLPLSVNRFEITRGEIHYRDPFREPKVDIALRDLQLLATNWTNVQDEGSDRFGRAWVRARAFESARLAGSLEADPLASPPEFRLAATSEGIELRELNDFLKAYGGFDVERGRLSVYAEVESKDGRFSGYVKPLVSDLEVAGEDEPDEGFFGKIWEGLVGAVAEVFENQAAGRQATRIPIEGSWSDPEVGLLSAIGNVLYNAFIEALPPKLEHPGRLSGDGDD